MCRIRVFYVPFEQFREPQELLASETALPNPQGGQITDIAIGELGDLLFNKGANIARVGNGTAVADARGPLCSSGTAACRRDGHARRKGEL
jgi:hypothetical protein